MNFDWNDLAFASKKPLNVLKPIFIAAPRDMSAARFTQLVKTYLPHGNLLLGLAKENFIDGYDGQPQFAAFKAQTVQKIITRVNAAGAAHKIYTLTYLQRDTNYILEKLALKKVVLVNGSWRYTFHTRPEYYTLMNRGIAYEMVSPFASEAEAKEYAERILPPEVLPKGLFTAKEMLGLARSVAQRSFDNSYQTGVTLGKKQGSKYRFITQAFSCVVPYQTYAMHHGLSRDVHFSPPGDLNHYDTAHAEINLIIRAQKERLDLRGTTLFINLLPCPFCARMFTQTDIAEFVYREDHSDGYGVKMLEEAGKKVTRMAR